MYGNVFVYQVTWAGGTGYLGIYPSKGGSLSDF
jgi:hypothetical protein